MNYGMLSLILTAIIGVFSVFAGKYWKKAKAFIKELGEALTTVTSALADDKITAEEMKKVVKEFMDVYLLLKS